MDQYVNTQHSGMTLERGNHGAWGPTDWYVRAAGFTNMMTGQNGVAWLGAGACLPLTGGSAGPRTCSKLLQTP